MTEKSKEPSRLNKSGKSNKPDMQSKPDTPNKQDNPDFRHLVRVSGVVLDGNKKISQSLIKIKGVGSQTAKVITEASGIDRNTQVGALDDSKIEKIETIIKNLDKHVPEWMLNRQKDYYEGNNIHVTGANLDMAKREDITRQQKNRSYKGIRHGLGLPVRGQRTRTSFRRGTTVGVSRKKR